MRKITTWQELRGCLVFVFPSLITQKWWDPWRESLFGFVFKFCFYYSILWFLSDEIWKLKILRYFQVMETKLWWYFCKYTHIEGPMVRPFTLSNTRYLLFFFLFLFFTLGLGHTFLYSFLLFFPFLFTLVSGFGCKGFFFFGS